MGVRQEEKQKFQELRNDLKAINAKLRVCYLHIKRNRKRNLTILRKKVGDVVA